MITPPSSGGHPPPAVIGTVLPPDVLEDPDGHPIAPEDLFSLSHHGDLSISPDGSQIAYCESRWQGDTRRHALAVLRSAGGEPRRLFEGTEEIFAPRWSRAGDQVYFAIMDRGAQTATGPHSTVSQIWRVAADGSGVQKISAVDGGIARYELDKQSGTIYFTKHLQREDAGSWPELRERFAEALELAPAHHKRSELWHLDPESGETSLVLRHREFISSFTLSPDGASAALVFAPDATLLTNEGQSGIERFDFGSQMTTPIPDGSWRSKDAAPHRWIGRATWSHDGSRLVFVVNHDALPPEIVLAEFPPTGPTTRLIPRPKECHPLLIGWDANGRLLLAADHRATIPLFSVDPDNPQDHTIETAADSCVLAISSSAECGRIAVLRSTPESFPQICLASGRAEQVLSSFDLHTSRWRFPSLSRYSWIARDGIEIEGVLELPPGHLAGSPPPPLVVNLHGGPNAASLFSRQFHIKGSTALAAQGYAVFHPNFRGSTGYGDDFIKRLIGRTNDVDVDDVLTGIDALIADGLASEDQLGAMGWSYGGYLTICLIATGRFQAVSCGAGALDMTLQFAAMDTPGHTSTLLDALPWEDPAEYLRSSPIFSLKPGINTATLIHTGDRDPRVPPTHARALHRVISHYLNAPCELLVYPGAGHQLTTRRQGLAKMTADQEWFDRYLRGS